MIASDLAARWPGGAHRRDEWWDVHCPAAEHGGDERPSLSLSDDHEKGRVRTVCRKGCGFNSIVAGSPFTLGDFFHAPMNKNGTGNGHHAVPGRRATQEAIYSYNDEAGELRSQTVRTRREDGTKDFFQRRPDGHDGFINDLKGITTTVYRLDKLRAELAALPAGERHVAVVEGERDADSLAALGIPTTCNPMGAGKWRDHHAAQLASVGAEGVYVFRDADTAGEAHAVLVSRLCRAAGLRVKRIILPGLEVLVEKHGQDVSDWLRTHTPADLHAVMLAAQIDTGTPVDTVPAVGPSPAALPLYIDTIAAFLDEEDLPQHYVFPELLPQGVIMLIHGEPRARKSLVAFELALSAATGTAPFNLPRFAPAAPLTVLYVQEEDPRALTKLRLGALVRARCGDARPATLHVSVRRGINLDDPLWVARLIQDLKARDVKLLVLDAARRLSAKTDEGPAKVRELIAVLRSIVDQASVTIVIVHHDVKPARDGQDQRRLGQRASGGDWFAGSECPVHVDRVNGRESMVFPQDYKFASDPAPFTVTCDVADNLITRLVGTSTTTDHAEQAGPRGKILDWLRANGPVSKTAMKKAGLGRWDTIEAVLNSFVKEGKVDIAPGRQAGSSHYFVVGGAVPTPGDGSSR